MTDIGEQLAKALQTSPESRTTEQVELSYTHYLLDTGWDPEALARFRTLQGDVRECRDGRAMTMVTQAWEPYPTRILPRGNWQDESGEVVAPGVPGFLPQPANPEGRRLTRLDLARWLMAPENPLTARVFVNRIWKQFFGTGITGVMDDVGAQGEWPTHPDLLDWLAVEFRESDWDVKHMVTLLVTSATYRQDSQLRPELREIDPNNRLLASQSPRRLEAEFVRDNALAIAGLLNPEIGGPSASPYQPAGYYENLQFPDRDYIPDRDERQYRRGLYTHRQRTFLHPMLANFDAPSREECTAARTVANTPQQALTLAQRPDVRRGRARSGSGACLDRRRVRRGAARPSLPEDARAASRAEGEALAPRLPRRAAAPLSRGHRGSEETDPHRPGPGADRRRSPRGLGVDERLPRHPQPSRDHHTILTKLLSLAFRAADERVWTRKPRVKAGALGKGKAFPEVVADHDTIEENKRGFRCLIVEGGQQPTPSKRGDSRGLPIPGL